MFCNETNGTLINQYNCNRINKYHFYHNNCLSKYATQLVNENKTLDDLVCTKCQNQFDYKTICELDKDAADILARNRMPSPGIIKTKPDKNEKFSELKNTKIHRCDIKHNHVKDGSDILCLGSTSCIHYYFKECL